jgi:hypothetical protein
MDFLDFMFRIEKRFGIKIERGDLRMLEKDRRPFDVTAGELYEWVVKVCETRGVKAPHSSWNGVRLELAKVVGKSPWIIHRETWVFRELGFS